MRKLKVLSTYWVGLNKLNLKVRYGIRENGDIKKPANAGFSTYYNQLYYSALIAAAKRDL